MLRPQTYTAPAAESAAAAWQPHVVSRISEGPELASPVCDEEPLEQGISVAICTRHRAGGLMRFLDSLAAQRLTAHRLIIVDSSDNDETERAFGSRSDRQSLARRSLYFRVTGPLGGLTRQRNFALQWVDTDLVAFFDDDTVLDPACLEQMEGVYRSAGGSIVGVGAQVRHDDRRPSRLWRLRRMLRIVSHLKPGSYCGSGMAVPWDLYPQHTELIEGDWLPGCAMMWNTWAARRQRFNEHFAGYSNGEDIEFSLRMRGYGRIVVAGTALVDHLVESGRPNAYQMAYATLRNAYYIQRHCLQGRTWKHGLWFLYAYGMDTLLRCPGVLLPGPRSERCQFVLGRLRCFGELLWPRSR